MANILDLTTFQEEYFDLKLFSGEVVKLRKPSQRLILTIMSFEQLRKQDADPMKVYEAVIDLVVDVLNNNASNMKFDKDYVLNTFSLEVIEAILGAYTDFAQKVNSNPN